MRWLRRNRNSNKGEMMTLKEFKDRLVQYCDDFPEELDNTVTDTDLGPLEGEIKLVVVDAQTEVVMVY